MEIVGSGGHVASWEAHWDGFRHSMKFIKSRVPSGLLDCFDPITSLVSPFAQCRFTSLSEIIQYQTDPEKRFRDKP